MQIGIQVINATEEITDKGVLLVNCLEDLWRMKEG